MADQSKKYKFDISNLNLHYGGFHALKDVNMQIEANKITAFIGPSGCGKSTFLKTLNRMNDLVENCKIDGKVLLDGTDIYKDMDEITLRYRVGMVFQQPNPFPRRAYMTMWHMAQELPESRKNRSWMRLWSEAWTRQLSGMN